MRMCSSAWMSSHFGALPLMDRVRLSPWTTDMMRSWQLTAVLVIGLNPASVSAQAPPLKLLFLGDNGHHRPAERFRQLQPVLSGRGIEIVYIDTATPPNPQNVGNY